MYTFPNLVLVCNVWTQLGLWTSGPFDWPGPNGASPPTIAELGTPSFSNLSCSLVAGRLARDAYPTSGVGVADLSGSTEIWFPPRAHVFDTGWAGGYPSVVEAPAGTGRTYILAYVDDVARGFANEYRRSQAFKWTTFSAWGGNAQVSATNGTGLFWGLGWPHPYP